MIKPKEEKKPLYALHILRRDEQHISVLESDNYDKVYEMYTEITNLWADCVKNSLPFSLKSPVVTTFDPGLIYEIKILPIMVEQTSSRYDNPYHQRMVKQGLGTSIPIPPILDEGYT